MDSNLNYNNNSKNHSPKVSLPTNFSLKGRARTAPKRYGYTNGNSNNITSFIPKNSRPLSNGGVKGNMGLNTQYFDDFTNTTWYPTNRPLKQWRKNGSSSIPPANINPNTIKKKILPKEKVQGSDIINIIWNNEDYVYIFNSNFKLYQYKNSYLKEYFENSALSSYDWFQSESGIVTLFKDDTQYQIKNWNSRSITFQDINDSQNLFYLETDENIDFLPIYGEINNLDCKYCINSNLSIGPELKMLGKNENGINKWLPFPKDAPTYTSYTGCESCPDGLKSNTCIVSDPTRGPVIDQSKVGPKTIKGNAISFSGNASIRTGVVIKNKGTFQNYKSYLKSRGKDFKTNQVVNKIPGVQYSKCESQSNCSSIVPVWPITPQQITNPNDKNGDKINVNSSLFNINTPTSNLNVPPKGSVESVLYGRAPTNPGLCTIGVYKPNNYKFSQQGAVSSSTLAARKTYNTITKNNKSFKPFGKPLDWGANSTSNKQNITPFNVNLSYSSDPKYFIKNQCQVRTPTATAFMLDGKSLRTITKKKTSFSKNKKYDISF